jgi:hypothetical protein
MPFKGENLKLSDIGKGEKLVFSKLPITKFKVSSSMTRQSNNVILPPPPDFVKCKPTQIYKNL